MATSISLTKDQWGEIYYALDTKARLIKDGFYGPQDKKGDNKRWIEALREIMAEISNKVDV